MYRPLGHRETMKMSGLAHNPWERWDGAAASHRYSEDLRSWLAYRKAHDQIFEALVMARCATRER